MVAETLRDGATARAQNSLLMNQMVAMVTEKKVSGGMSTGTRAAVREKRRKMLMRLKATRRRSLTLEGGKGGHIYH